DTLSVDDVEQLNDLAALEARLDALATDASQERDSELTALLHAVEDLRSRLDRAATHATSMDHGIEQVAIDNATAAASAAETIEALRRGVEDAVSRVETTVRGELGTIEERLEGVSESAPAIEAHLERIEENGRVRGARLDAL